MQSLPEDVQLDKEFDLGRFDHLLDQLHSSTEGVDLLIPHIVFMLNKSAPFSAKFLVLVFDRVAQVLGMI